MGLILSKPTKKEFLQDIEVTWRYLEEAATNFVNDKTEQADRNIEDAINALYRISNYLDGLYSSEAEY